ncbi:ribonuclease P protein component [Aliikangiella coralliicola]|uniref:Ribonuclease P protein component n=1 Tax=Aliikangiella coralliicola TaxID=2592383 RepID=A0A545UGI8_9GAMM|nr:ribonuclease P protein component [Aliikangiella coralliicola]TQV88594.1 ribonuclease P protein component [Aliikangiella coralliicola]
MINASFKFQQELRLLTAKDFSRVFDKAFKVNNKAFTLLARKNNLKHPRLGLVIAKKNLKFAYQRNLVKRLLREEFRVRQHTLDGYDLVILTRRDIAVLPKTDIIRLRDDLFDKFHKKCKRF